MKRRYYTILLQIILSSFIYSQTESLEKNTLLEKYRFDFAVPDQPAFNILGVNPSNILRPANVSEVALIVSDFFNNKSVLIPKSLSVEVAPFLLVKSNKITFQDYINNTWFNSLRVSVGSTDYSEGNDSRHNLAFGLRSTILDNSKKNKNFKALLRDIYSVLSNQLDVDDSIQEKFKRVKNLDAFGFAEFIKDPKNKSEYDNFAQKELMNYTDQSEIIDKKVSKLKESFTGKNWNSTTWDIACAVLFDSKDSLVKNLEFSTFSAWTTLAFPLGRVNIWGQMLVGVKYNYTEFDSVDVSSNLSTIKRNTASVSTRLNFGMNRLKGFTELGYNYEDIKDRNHSGLFNLGTEINITDGIWLNFNAGAEFKTKEKRNFFTDFNVKFQLPENFKLF